MDVNKLRDELIKDFNLQDLPETDREEMLVEVAKTIERQFLFDVFDILGEQKFEALQASANMGEDFYNTTLKHLLPNCEEVFNESRKKVAEAFKKGE
ncbi:MAG: hypothetical protein JWN37_162 [Candidatus Nomurabacteria bacterium]|nr:hypothetical protein [Candidatus Nomurabacteria bacterium]